MLFSLVTLFPDFFTSFLQESLIGRALATGAFSVNVVDIRDFTEDRHRTVDDRPFGGGPGMVLKPEPVCRAVAAALESEQGGNHRVVLLTPAGHPLNQAKVRELSELDHLVLVCGRYEGVDERVSRLVVDEEISIGDFVLSGGEVPAMVVVEAVTRLLPGVLGKTESLVDETFSDGLLEYPHYTRPREYQGLDAPEVLLSGDHQAIKIWRLKESLKRTMNRRPDLLAGLDLSFEERKILDEIKEEI